MNNFASPSIASAGDWRKRRRFMDATRPKVDAMLPAGREERIYEDSLFAEVPQSFFFFLGGGFSFFSLPSPRLDSMQHVLKSCARTLSKSLA